ncbi:alpha/beta hydrolase fold domain-containing protein [Carboxylicivirga taeanensis]|uniref:alpha/beta hydrolase fold domain-containing protein n=1 Tax=Carboxylicivirga taeanensis TaxID=1416875 RepID=UPI003F6DE98F
MNGIVDKFKNNLKLKHLLVVVFIESMNLLSIPLFSQDIGVYHPSVPTPTLSSVSYGMHERQILDFWKAKSNIPTPLVFVIHGGGWKVGSKERVHKFVNVQKLLDAGISVVAINYRLISQVKDSGIMPPVKIPMYDAAQALQYVRSKAWEWNIDKDRIGAAGGSAGACTSLWLAFHDDLADPDAENPILHESTRLVCAAVMQPQTSLDPKQMKAWIPNISYGSHAFDKANFEEFIAERESILPWIAEYSPYGHVSKDDPPTYLSYYAPPAIGEAQADPVHSANFGAKLKERCEGAGISCEVYFPGALGVKYNTTTDFLIENLRLLESNTK